MGKSQRVKGKRAEQNVVRALNSIPSVAVKRNLTETREGNAGDVLGQLLMSAYQRIVMPRGTGLVNLVCQVKHRATPSPWKAQNEADAAMTSPSDIAFGWVRRNGGETLITMRPDTFLMILGMLNGDQASQAHVRAATILRENHL